MAVSLEEESCSICFDSIDFRVLACGHYFCFDCLTTLHQRRDGEIPCPFDRQIDRTHPLNLLKPNEFQGRIFRQSESELSEPFTDINQLLDSHVKLRFITIEKIRLVASRLRQLEMDCEKAKVGGSVAGVLGGFVTILGLTMSLTGIGAVFGLPLSIFGASVGAIGGATTGITIVVDYVLKKLGIDEIELHLKKDHFRSEQINVVMIRSAADSAFARKWKIAPFESACVTSFIPRLTKIGITTTATIKAGMGASIGIGRVAATGGLHFAGIALAAALIPIDLFQMVKSSIRINNNDVSKVIKDIEEKATKLENELKLFLMDGNFFHLIHCRDQYNCNRWVYAIISASKLGPFLTRKQNFHSFNYEEVHELGRVIKEGKGNDVPDRIKQAMETEWNDLHKTYYESLALNVW